MTAHAEVAHAATPILPIRQSKFTRKQVMLAAIGLALLAAGADYGWNWLTVGRYIESTDDAYVGGDVTVIGSKVAGFIAAVAVTDNQQVHAGDLLVRLDDRDYRAALAKADAAVQAQQALLNNLDATKNLQQAVIGQAQAELTGTQAESMRAKDDQQRYRILAGKAAVSVQSEQKADASYQQAVASNQKAQAKLLAAQREIQVIATRREQGEAALAQAIAERDIARLNLSYTELRAPIDGVIGNRHARAGAYASTGTQLLSIVPVHGLWIDANFKENQLVRMRPGQPVSIEADAMPGHTLHGHIASLAPATGAQFSVLPAENATGNFTKIVQRVPVRVLLDASDGTLGALRPGLSVTAEVNVKAGQS